MQSSSASTMVLAFLLVLAPGFLRAQQWEVLADGFREFEGDNYEVRDVEEVNREPLFDNLPFLHLRPGDRLVKAKWADRGPKPSGDPEQTSYFLSSRGKYYVLWGVDAEGDHLTLSDAYASVLFDWDVSLANASKLRALMEPRFAPLTTEQFRAICTSVGREFPESIVNGNPDSLKGPRIVSIPGKNVVEMDGIYFDEFNWDCVYRYTIRLGSAEFLIFGEPLIRGPKRVETFEFESDPFDAPNSGEDPDPEIAKIKKSEYERMMRFQKLVKEAIHSAKSRP